MSTLPIDPLLPEILARLEAAGSLVLQAAPGAGKTTRVPLALADAPFLAGRKVLVLEPRRLAARMAARHMAAGLGEAPGGRVGYRVRLESRVGPATRVELLTDGLYLRRLQQDPALEGVGCVVFDEFHERGLESDLALAFTLEARAALAPDLKLLVMSATLDAGPVAALLGGAPVVASEGRAHPVSIRWAERPPARLEPAVAEQVLQALAQDGGGVLVFLPGAAEIRRVAALLEAARLPPDVAVFPLAGELEGAAQEAAVAPPVPGRRKVVLATAIAETSLTIEGIGTVVDAGLARAPRYDARAGMTRLVTLPASQATATQRAGRAGRLGPGVCRRLWTEAEHRGRPAQPSPEILAGDPTGMALELALWGGGDGSGLALLDRPPPGPLAQARLLLADLGALDTAGRVTPHGRAMAGLGLHPRLAHMILAAKAQGLGRLACAVAALVGERDLFRRRSEGGPPEADLRPRLEALLGQAQDPRVDRGALAQARRVLDLLCRQAGLGRHATADPREAGRVVALAWPDRVGLPRPGQHGRFRLASGRGAVLPPEDALAGAAGLAVAALDGEAEGARIFLAAPLEPAEIEALFADRISTEELVTWDARSEAVLAVRRRRLAALPLGETRLSAPDPAALQAALAEGLRQLGPAALPWTPAARALQARLRFLRRLAPEDWPDASDEALLAELDWLAPQLAGVTRRAHLARLDLAAALLGLLDHRRRRALDRLAPTALPLPSGRSATLDYSGDTPVLAVKLQELFGQRSTPSVAEGRVPVLLHLLSPAGRPLQVTQDLEGFWRGSYAAVRAEMRGRYPKHRWPEDPLAEAPGRR